MQLTNSNTKRVEKGKDKRSVIKFANIFLGPDLGFPEQAWPQLLATIQWRVKLLGRTITELSCWPRWLPITSSLYYYKVMWTCFNACFSETHSIYKVELDTLKGIWRILYSFKAQIDYSHCIICAYKLA